MSRLSEMIKELCPDGVAYKKLGEIGTLIRGKRFVKNDFIEDGVPAIHYGELYTHYGIFASKVKTHIRQEIASKMRYAHQHDIVIVGAGETIEDIGIGVAWLGKMDVAVHDACYIFHHDMNPVFISYVLRTEDYHRQLKKYITTGKISSISANGLGQAIIPVPPLAIQNEIVKLLDNFTELTAELTAELQLRKKQYSFYRDSLLNFSRDDVDVEWRTLGETCDTLSGFPFDSSQFTSSGVRLMRGMNVKRGVLDFREENNRYWKGYDGLEKYLLESDDIIIAMDGSLVGQSYGLVKEEQRPLLLVQRVARVRSRKANPHYIYHYISSGRFTDYVNLKRTAGAVPHISLRDIEHFKIPFPSTEKQNQIAAILDRFDALCHDLTQGLPAEIAARKKQYEYYRDKLLTFPRKGESGGSAR